MCLFTNVFHSQINDLISRNMVFSGFAYYFYSKDPMVGNITCAVVISTLVVITICFCCVFVRLTDDDEPVPLEEISLGIRTRSTRHRRQTVVYYNGPQPEVNSA